MGISAPRMVVVLAVVCRTGLVQTQCLAPAAGTYELTWFSQNSITSAPLAGHLLLVLANRSLPKSLRRRMDPTDNVYGKRPPAGRACWRLLDGSIPMGAGKPIVTDWRTGPGDTVAVTLWFSVDAGTSIRLWGDSVGVRGIASASGWMSSPPDGHSAPRALRDSIVGHRVGPPDPDRCLR